ncbi:hypothetical protein BDM02DRAFT_3123088 [Thelephora ganbajun]|uniref:Uncharacterized protein n=1 Tax=Thelephora ganbajun TaxID=370292 RepID=A0ACB6Z2G7_THEGA|nr:hypothetical protein BDM02DRAFT_3123088 [Thelephora ganbajun]
MTHILTTCRRDRLQHGINDLARPLSRRSSFPDSEHRWTRGSQHHYYAETRVSPSPTRAPSSTSLCPDPESISRTLARRWLGSHSICTGGVTPHQRVNVAGVLQIRWTSREVGCGFGVFGVYRW